MVVLYIVINTKCISQYKILQSVRDISDVTSHRGSIIKSITRSYRVDKNIVDVIVLDLNLKKEYNIVYG